MNHTDVFAQVRSLIAAAVSHDEQMCAALAAVLASLRVAEVCADWVSDIGTCHLCDYEHTGRHDDECPMRLLTLSLSKFRPTDEKEQT